MSNYVCWACSMAKCSTAEQNQIVQIEKTIITPQTICFIGLKPIISDNTFPTNKHTIYKLINFNLETVSVNLAWATISRSIYWLLYRWKVQHYLRGLVPQQIYTQNFVPSNEFPWFYLKTYCFYSFTWPELWY